MNIIARVKEILLTPKDAWPVIAGEEASVAGLYTQYIMILAAIQAVAGFIGMSIFGIGGFGMTMRVPVMTGLTQMVLGYALGLAMVYVVALIADMLAPKFGGQQNSLSALKLIAYSSTAGMVGGIFALLPALGVLTILAALYSLYLLYLGAPVMMKVPQEKALPYTAVLVVCAVVIGALSGVLLGSMHGSPMMQSSAVSPAAISIETPEGKVSIDLNQAGDWAKRMEAVGKRMETAQQAGDQAAMEQAVKEMTELQRDRPAIARP